MITKIDWISFSVLVGTDEGRMSHEMPSVIVAALRQLSPDLDDLLSMGEDFEVRSGRAPYSASWARLDGGLVVFAHPALPHALVEVSGRGCERLQAADTLAMVLAAVGPRTTRIDIACDALTDTRPVDFVSERAKGRFKAHSEVISKSGETCYVGARTSDRYARVYRYNEPHERAHLLRVEYVLKAEQAKETVKTLLHREKEEVAAALGDAFGWQHPVWNMDYQPRAELAVWRPERRQGKTLYWLNSTVAPLLARLHREGTIDATKWLQDNVLSDRVDGNDQ